jgi:hypothetical protein
LRRLAPDSRSNAASKEASTKKTNFRARYDEAERYRAELIDRLSRLKGLVGDQPRYAKRLLNYVFRKSSVEQRSAVLAAAAWLIDIFERL